MSIILKKGSVYWIIECYPPSKDFRRATEDLEIVKIKDLDTLYQIGRLKYSSEKIAFRKEEKIK